MTEPRDRAPDEPLEPADDDLADEVVKDIDAELDTYDVDARDDTIDAEDVEGADIDDADVDEAEGELLDEAEADAIEAEQAGIDDYEAAIREVAGEDVPIATPAERRTSAQRRAEGKRTTRAPSPSEIAVHVREDWSRAFVIIAVGVFVAILLNGMLLGTGGLLRPIATPTPIPTESPSASPSSSASPSASPAAS